MYLMNEAVPKKKVIRQGKKQLEHDLRVAGTTEPTLFTEAKEIGGIEGKCHLGFSHGYFNMRAKQRGLSNEEI